MLKLRRIMIVYLVALPVLLALFCMRAEAFTSLQNTVEKADLDIDLLSAGQAEIVEQYEIVSETGFRRFQLDVWAPLQGQMTTYELDVANPGSEPVPGLFTEIIRYDPDSGQGRAPFSYEVSSQTEDKQGLTITGKFEPGRWVFRMRYTLKDAVLRSEDKAIFRFHFFPSTKTPLDSVGMTLSLPSGLEDPFDLVFISETPVNYVFDDDRTFMVAAQHLKAYDQSRFLLSLPATVFTELPQSPDSRSAKDQVNAANTAASRAMWRGSLLNEASSFLPIGLVAACLLWLLYYLYFEREGLIRRTRPDFALWTSSVPPAISAMLLGRQKLAPLILSTLLRLTNRRTLRLEGYVFTWQQPDRIDYSLYSTFEVFLIHWFFGEITDGDPAASAIQAKAYAKNKNKEERFEESVKQMEKELTRSFANMRFLDRRKSWYAGLIGFVFGFAITIFALLLVFLTRSVFAYLLLLPGLLFIWSSRGLKHLNEEGLKRHTEARAYRDNLGSMQKIFDSSGSSYTEIEAVIIALPRALAYGKTEGFFEGLKQFPVRRYIRLAQALLKIYDNQDPPRSFDRDLEYKRCLQDMDKLKETLLSSLSILNQVFN